MMISRAAESQSERMRTESKVDYNKTPQLQKQENAKRYLKYEEAAKKCVLKKQ